MIAFLLGASAYGAIDVCIDITTNFTDNGDTDYFKNNGPNTARHVKFKAVFKQQSSGQWITTSTYGDNNGCFDTGAVVGDKYLTVMAFTETWRNGVVAKAFAVAPTGFNDEAVSSVSWYTGAPTGAQLNYTIPASQVWNHTMLASFSWHRTSSLHLSLHSSRNCCLSGEDHDGTCLSGTTNAYTDFGTPMEIRMYAGGSSVCGGSTYSCDTDGDGILESNGCPGVYVTCPRRMAIMHEQGHVVVEKRIGRRTLTNDLDLRGPITDVDKRACIGQHVPENPVEFLGWQQKGELKEDHQSTAAREGWASFYSAWIFNRYWQPNCTYANDITLYDYDLDGADFLDVNTGEARVTVVNMDNDYPANPGNYDCHNHGVGDLGEVTDTGIETAAWTEGDDWLEAASSNDHCDLHNGSINDRGTAYDWASFFWRLSNSTTEGQGLSITKLTDLYVDMCPTSWHNDLNAPVHEDRRVMNRLTQSASVNGVTTEVIDERHRGQDH